MWCRGVRTRINGKLLVVLAGPLSKVAQTEINSAFHIGREFVISGGKFKLCGRECLLMWMLFLGMYKMKKMEEMKMGLFTMEILGIFFCVSYRGSHTSLVFGTVQIEIDHVKQATYLP